MKGTSDFIRTAPKVPGYSASSMSVIRPAIGHGDWRTSKKSPLIQRSKMDVAAVSGRGRLDMALPSAKPKPKKVKPYEFSAPSGPQRKAKKPKHYGDHPYGV